MENRMDILHIERKGPMMNTWERHHIYNLYNDNLHINDTHNPIFNVIRDHYEKLKCPATNPPP
jgi:hypothetical protein